MSFRVIGEDMEVRGCFVVCFWVGRTDCLEVVEELFRVVSFW